jgi:hypothetical protein
MEPITAVLQRMKLNVELESDGWANGAAAGHQPAHHGQARFPSDMVSLVTVLAQAEGDADPRLDNELRLFALGSCPECAPTLLCDRTASSCRAEQGARPRPRQPRSGMAPTAAALAAEGRSTLGPLETVERGCGRGRRLVGRAGPSRAGRRPGEIPNARPRRRRRRGRHRRRTRGRLVGRRLDGPARRMVGVARPEDAAACVVLRGRRLRRRAGSGSS